MQKTILITGSTDGIGFETAKLLAADGHQILLHGRNPQKLETTAAAVGGNTQSFVADLSLMDDVEAVTAKISKLDVLINNAGVLKASSPLTTDGLDIRFVVNTFAPYLLTKRLLPEMEPTGRIINLSSAAQASVSIKALTGESRLSDMEAYAQSKLAITMWSRELAKELTEGPVVVAVNPGSLLASKMVRERFGVAGNDLSIGAEILYRAALSDEFKSASGRYFDNDAGRFNEPHTDAHDPIKSGAVVTAIETTLREKMNVSLA